MKTAKQTESKNVERKLISRKEAAQLLGIGLTTFLRNCELKLIGPAPIRIAGAVRWNIAELNDWISAGCPNREAWQRRKKAKA